MKEFISKVKRIPWWGILAGFGFFALQRGMYRLGDFVSRVTGTIDHAFACKIAAIDDLIPVVPVFIVIYVYSFIFWLCGPMAVSLTKKRNFINFCIYMLLAYFIGFLFFAFVPTYMDRVAEGLMKVGENKDVFSKLLFMIYQADGSEMAFNLMPSYHCLISACCYFGVKDQEEISKGFQNYSLIMTILICISTLFTKQHYIIDVVLGLFVAWLSYFIVSKLDPGKKFDK